MAHSITVRLNKPAREFQAGENIGFNIRAGVQYYDRQTKKKEWICSFRKWPAAAK